MKEGHSQALFSVVLDKGHWQTELWSKAMVGELSMASQSSSCPRLLGNVKVRGGEDEMIATNTTHVH